MGQVRRAARLIDSHLCHEQEHFGFVRFFQQAGGPEVHDLFLEVRVLRASHEDDGNIFGESKVLHVTGETEAVLVWKANVQQEEVGAIMHGHHEGLKGIVSDGGLKAKVPQTHTDGGCGVGVIFNDKDLFHRLGHGCGGSVSVAGLMRVGGPGVGFHRAGDGIEQLFGFERFFEVIKGAKAAGHLGKGLEFAGGNINNWNVAEAQSLKALSHREAKAFGHHDVHHDDVRLLVEGLEKPIDAGGRGQDIIALVFQSQGDCASNFEIIFNKEDSFHRFIFRLGKDAHFFGKWREGWTAGEGLDRAIRTVRAMRTVLVAGISVAFHHFCNERGV
jgi:hypothetical protein